MTNNNIKYTPSSRNNTREPNISNLEFDHVKFPILLCWRHHFKFDSVLLRFCQKMKTDVFAIL